MEIACPGNKFRSLNKLLIKNADQDAYLSASAVPKVIGIAIGVRNQCIIRFMYKEYLSGLP